MSQWHLHDTTSNQRLGPMDTDAARAAAARNPSLLAWKDGMGDWLPVRNIAELVDGVPGDPASAPPPPPRNGGKGRADEIDFRIHGHWRFMASLHDFVNTVFWPLMLWLLARYSRVMK